MGEPEAKRSKKESENKGADDEELELTDLASFKLTRVLNENSERKEIFLEGRFTGNPPGYFTHAKAYAQRHTQSGVVAPSAVGPVAILHLLK